MVEIVLVLIKTLYFHHHRTIRRHCCKVYFSHLIVAFFRVFSLSTVIARPIKFSNDKQIGCKRVQKCNLCLGTRYKFQAQHILYVNFHGSLISSFSSLGFNEFVRKISWKSDMFHVSYMNEIGCWTKIEQNMSQTHRNGFRIGWLRITRFCARQYVYYLRNVETNARRNTRSKSYYILWLYMRIDWASIDDGFCFVVFNFFLLNNKHAIISTYRWRLLLVAQSFGDITKLKWWRCAAVTAPIKSHSVGKLVWSHKSWVKNWNLWAATCAHLCDLIEHFRVQLKIDNLSLSFTSTNRGYRFSKNVRKTRVHHKQPKNRLSSCEQKKKSPIRFCCNLSTKLPLYSWTRLAKMFSFFMCNYFLTFFFCPWICVYEKISVRINWKIYRSRSYFLIKNCKLSENNVLSIPMNPFVSSINFSVN